MEEKTPLMMQYASIKKQYPHALLLFQVGDFYEFFHADAEKAATILGITLTKRGTTKDNVPIPLCGIPVHNLEIHLKKLIMHGLTVAICDQLELAHPGTLVKRGVTQIFTPGTLSDSNLLAQKKSSYLVSVGLDDTYISLVIFEILTGIMQYTLIKNNCFRSLEIELMRFSPDEIIVKKNNTKLATFLREYIEHVTPVDLQENDKMQAKTWCSSFDQACKSILHKTPGLEEAFSLIHYYTFYTKNDAVLSCTKVIPYQAEEYVLLDNSTKKNLELVEHEQTKKNTLFDVLDRCMTPMGSRLLKKFILFPLSKKTLIEQRLRITHYFFQQYTLMVKLRTLLNTTGDLERLIGRISLNKGTFADYISLKRILFSTPLFLELVEYIALKEEVIPKNRITEYQQLINISSFLDKALNDDSNKPYIIKSGYSEALDKVRMSTQQAKERILLFEKQEQEKTGINSLKIRHHVSYGYVIEITKSHLDKIPPSYKRLQTLVGKERYISDELETLSNAIENASKQGAILEEELFTHIKSSIMLHLPILRHIAFSYAFFDVFSTFSHNAHEQRYVLPQMNEDHIINIFQGRHPVIEQYIENSFVPNDIFLDNQNFFIILTGPNMGGKSTYLRQTAQICLLAHIGSFVPAKSANIMVLDRIFTRVGGHDNVTKGKSTFFVEMEETATICNYATKKSLILVDEVGRGTGIKEGIALAQAIVEYLYKNVGAPTIFATHYHELGHLTTTYPFMKPFFMETKICDERTLFLHTIAPGICWSSFALEVAHLAQLPEPIIKRARELLNKDIYK